MPYTTFSDEQVDELITSINRDGFAVLPDWASPEQLRQFQLVVERTAAEAGNDYVALNGQEAVIGTPLYEWGGAGQFLELCKRIVASALGEPSKDPSLKQVLRCLTGKGGRRESLIFHYDSFVLTTIMPVCMPQLGETGDLLMLPNQRPLRSHYARNLLDKLLVDNPWAQRYLKRRVIAEDCPFTRIAMQPGHMYLFWGYRSLHTNMPVASDALRATAVFHYHNVHGSSSLAGRLRRSLGLIKPLPTQTDLTQV
jgi:hypothetical protein